MSTIPRAAVRWLSDGAPWWVATSVGSVLVVVGVGLVLRPFRSLSVLVLVVAVAMAATGIAALADSGGGRRPFVGRFVGLLWVGAGAVAVAWPALTVRGIALVAGVGMIVSGIAEVAGAARATADERAASLLWGLASVVFGLLALSWPDVTLLVVAVVFGVRTTVVGIRAVVSGLRRRTGRPTTSGQGGPRTGFRRWAHTVAVGAGLVLALGLAVISVLVHRSVGVVDAFYTPPDTVPTEAGRLIRAEQADRHVPEGARGWRILYTTTRDARTPAVASALVLAPGSMTADASAPLDVVAWAHGTTGVARHCAPTVMTSGLAAGAFELAEAVLDEGWVLVATDYTGLGTEGPHPYLIGEGEAHSVLDAVRAARQLDELDLSPHTVVWGHSQGGHAALWTGIRADDDVPLRGVAALAPASDLVALVDHLPTVTGGSIFATYVVEAYSRHYPDVRRSDHVRPAALPTFERTAGRCLDATVLASGLSSVAMGFDGLRNLRSGPLLDRLAENVPDGTIDAPVLLAQGEADTLIPAAMQIGWVERACARGTVVEHRTYPGLDHLSLVAAGSPLVDDLLAWTRDRFTGLDAPSTCPG